MCNMSILAHRQGCRQSHAFHRIKRSHSNLRCRRTIACCEAATHNENQRRIFDKKAALFAKPLPPEIEEKLARIISAVPDISGRRIIDGGSGTGCLIPHMQAAGASDILAVDLSPKMLSEIDRRFGRAPTLGNSAAVRTWLGDICELPDHQGMAHAIYLNGMFGNLLDPHAALLKCCTLLQPEGYVIVSHPLGRAWHTGLHKQDPAMVPHELPDEGKLRALVADLPVKVASFVDEDDFYLAALQIPHLYALEGGPMTLQGEVVEGFQRGSKKMGVPTANIAPLSVLHKLADKPEGVFFGWAQLQEAASEVDGKVYPMVLNYGVRPTFKDGSNVTVEAHIMHKYAQDFYGSQLKALVVGYLRPEMKFASIDSLISRIRADIGIAKRQLDQQDARAAAPEGFWT